MIRCVYAAIFFFSINEITLKFSADLRRSTRRTIVAVQSEQIYGVHFRVFLVQQMLQNIYLYV